MQQKSTQFSHITILRTFAILIVVFGHGFIIYQQSWGIFSAAVGSVFFSFLKLYLDTFLMPLFVLVSGYLFYYAINERGKYASFSQLVKYKTFRLLVPYIFVALFYIVPLRYLVGYENYVNQPFLRVLIEKIILMRDNGNLWFLGMLFGISILTWFIEKKTKLHAVVKFGIYAALYFVSLLVPTVLQIDSVLHYMIYFFMGGLLLKKRHKLDWRMPKILILLAVNIIGYIGFLYLDNLDGLILSVCKHMILFVSSLGGVLFYFALALKVNSDKIAENKFVRFIDKNSFGIYLFHEGVIYISYFYLCAQCIAPICLVLINFTVGLTVSLVITEALRRLGLGFVMGERLTRSPKPFTHT